MIANRFLPGLAAVAMVLSACQPGIAAAEVKTRAPSAERIAKEGSGLKTAIFAGGCFWGVEAVFSHMKGVRSAVSGYHGGNAATATYKRVTTGTTQHAEAVKVVYDPKVVRYDQLLRVFFSVVADPTLRNRQGPDSGPHYNAEIVPLTTEQRIVATAYLNQMKASGKWKRPIVTKIRNARKFYPAESYHQDFMAENPRHPYIVRWDAPKVKALREFYPSLYRSTFRRN